MAIRHAREQGSRVLAICNVNGSTIPRESDAVVYTYAGPEIAVASTKAFLTQIVAVHLVALYLAQVRGTKWSDEIASHVRRAGWHAARRSTGCSTPSNRCEHWLASWSTPRRCCSSAVTSGSRWRSRGR